MGRQLNRGVPTGQKRLRRLAELFRHRDDDISFRRRGSEVVGAWKQITFNAFVLQTEGRQQIRIGGLGEKFLLVRNLHLFEQRRDFFDSHPFRNRDRLKDPFAVYQTVQNFPWRHAGLKTIKFQRR